MLNNFVLKFRNNLFLILNIKVFLYHSYAGTEEGRYGSHPFTTHKLALEGGGWSAPHSGCFTPSRKGTTTWYPLYRRLGGLWGQSGWCRKSQVDRIWFPDCPVHNESLHWLKWHSVFVLIVVKTEWKKLRVAICSHNFHGFIYFCTVHPSRDTNITC